MTAWLGACGRSGGGWAMELNELYTDIITEYAKDKAHWHPLEHADITLRGVNPS